MHFWGSFDHHAVNITDEAPGQLLGTPRNETMGGALIDPQIVGFLCNKSPNKVPLISPRSISKAQGPRPAMNPQDPAAAEA